MHERNPARCAECGRKTKIIRFRPGFEDRENLDLAVVSERNKMSLSLAMQKDKHRTALSVQDFCAISDIQSSPMRSCHRDSIKAFFDNPKDSSLS
jgi:hypothetical protein